MWRFFFVYWKNKSLSKTIVKWNKNRTNQSGYLNRFLTMF
ncbi:hypothetical protein PNI0010_02261 [Streptococcus pneumoniae PNI0010]|nr:hypothetical protein PNI0010_02261 [Streptococcus pneumoniae PNI0010]